MDIQSTAQQVAVHAEGRLADSAAARITTLRGASAGSTLRRKSGLSLS